MVLTGVFLVDNTLLESNMKGFIFLHKYASLEEMENDKYPGRTMDPGAFNNLIRNKTVQNLCFKGGGATSIFLDDVTIFFTDQSSLTFRLQGDTGMATINYVPPQPKPRHRR